MNAKLIMGNSYTKLQAEDKFIINLAWKALSYKVQNIDIIRRKTGNFRMPSEKSMFDRRSNTFMTGLIGKVMRAFAVAGVQFDIDDRRVKPGSGLGDYSLHDMDFFPHQVRAIEDFATASRGVAFLPTGAGKTECAIGVTKGLGLPTLFLTHRQNLMWQTARRFVKRLPEMEKHIGTIGSGTFNPNHITIATVQTLQNFIKEDVDGAKQLLADYKLLIVDEAHRSGASYFHTPALLCENAFYRMALTATPFMKDSPEEDMCLMGISGDVVAKVSFKELIDAGILAKPFFKFYKIDTPNMAGVYKWRDVYERGITHNEYRNNVIVKNAVSTVKAGKPTLIIVHETEHGVLLDKMVKAAGLRSEYVSGKDAVKVREKALDKIAKDRLDVLVCTNIFDEGVDVNNIGAVILAAGNKSAPSLFQRTGRAIRRKEEDNYAVIIDFIDAQHPKLLEHSAKRYNLVKNTEGFTILGSVTEAA